jgi:pantothenate kinase
VPLITRGQAVARAVEHAARGGRTLLGLAGAPGAGKSTLAAALARSVPGAVVVPMDGFHRPTAWLAARGLVERRGAPETFDAKGYVALLAALRAGGDVRAPDFDRTREEPVPDAITVPAGAPLVITEGNYLLLDIPPWHRVREQLHEAWFVEVPEAVRVERLVTRFVSFGHDPVAARDRVLHGSDAANARLVAASRDRADRVVDPDRDLDGDLDPAG